MHSQCICEEKVKLILANSCPFDTLHYCCIQKLCGVSKRLLRYSEGLRLSCDAVDVSHYELFRTDV